MSKKLIKLSKSCISEKEKLAVLEVLESEYLGMGEYVKIFEEKLSEYLSNNVICVSSGTAALHLALESLNLKPKDEVLLPSLTYLSSFQAVKAAGAKPVACDINLNSLTIDISDLKKKITKNTKVIMPVHYSGGVFDMDEIYEIAKKNQLRVVEDAAHAFGSYYNKSLVGSKGDIICFSFDGIKNITSGEGGCLCTSDKKILEKVKNLRLLGVENDSNFRYKNQRNWNFDVKDIGWRYHMSNLMAAIGITQLERFEELSQKRKALAKKYNDLIHKSNSYISTLDRNYDEIVPHIYVVRIKNMNFREELREKLLEQNIQTGVHYFPNHLLSLFKNPNVYLKNTEKIFNELLTLPLHPDLSLDDIKYIVNTLIKEVNFYHDRY